jgi:magnesium chelatase subunit I
VPVVKELVTLDGGSVQVRSVGTGKGSEFTVRLPLDLCMVFSANPEDYTNRGRIITPLKDRIGSVVRTHYPLNRDLGVRIVEEQAWLERDQVKVVVPPFLKETVEEVSRLARSSPHVNQSSGVSVRMSIANVETLVSNAERRALLGERGGLSALDSSSILDPKRRSPPMTVARISDLYWMAASSRGKIELALSEETGDEDRLIHRLIEEAVKNVFDQFLSPKRFANVFEHFSLGGHLKLDGDAPAAEFLQAVGTIRGFRGQLETIAKEVDPELAGGPLKEEFLVTLAELVLERTGSGSRIVSHPLPADDPTRRRPERDVIEGLSRIPCGWRGAHSGGWLEWPLS